MEFGDFLGRGTDVVGGVSGYEEVDFGGIVFLWRSGGGIGIDVDIPAWKDFRILVPMAKSANSLEKT